MARKLPKLLSGNKVFALIKWGLTAISGALTTAFILLLAPVSS